MLQFLPDKTRLTIETTKLQCINKFYDNVKIKILLSTYR